MIATDMWLTASALNIYARFPQHNSICFDALLYANQTQARYDLVQFVQLLQPHSLGRLQIYLQTKE